MKRILFISHDASLTGAPMIVLFLIEWFKQNFPKVSVDVLLIEGGSLEDEFIQKADSVFNLKRTINNSISNKLHRKIKTKLFFNNTAKKRLYNSLKSKGYDIIYANSAVSIPIANEIKTKYLKNEVSHIIFSQHFSLNERVTIKNELEYYYRIIKLNSVDNEVILFKPHPRDLIEKVNEIKKWGFKNLLIIEEKFQGIPIELFVSEKNLIKSKFITACSSAPLCFERNENVICVQSEELINVKLNSKIVEFAEKNMISLLEV